MTVAMVAETRISHSVARVSAAPAAAPRSLSHQVRDRPHQSCYREVHNHCEAVAQAASINLISANEMRLAMVKSSGDRIFVIDIRKRRVGEEFGVNESVLADLGKWRVQIRRDFDDLF